MGRVSKVDNEVTTFRMVGGEAVMSSTRMVLFDKVEVWSTDGKLSLDKLLIELSPESLGVERGATVIWLLKPSAGDQWAFVDHRSAYFLIDDALKTAVNLEHNQKLWTPKLWPSSEFRKKFEKYLPPDPRTYRELMSAASKPLPSGRPVMIELLEAVLDTRFGRSQNDF
ncbi:MAG: hypothetical protein WAW92_02335 [Minisyncoccia bacterium]